MLWEKAAGVQEALVLADVEQLIAPMPIYPIRPDRGVELPQFGGQVSGLHGGECTGSDELLFVFDWAEVANR